MISPSTAEVIRMLEQDDLENNTLQRVLMEFLRRKLKDELTIEIGKRRWMGDESSIVTVELRLNGEIISSSDMYL